MFKYDIKKITAFIKSNNIEHLNLEFNHFDDIPLELIILMTDCPSLQDASLKGNFDLHQTKGAGAKILPMILGVMQSAIEPLATLSGEQLAEACTNFMYKRIYIADGVPPILIPISKMPEAQKTFWEKCKPFLLHGISVVVGAVAAEGSHYLFIWISSLGGENPESSSSY
jgi:hypothetical protein